MPQVKHAPSSTADMIRWLEDKDTTIKSELRQEIAERLKRLEFYESPPQWVWLEQPLHRKNWWPFR